MANNNLSTLIEDERQIASLPVAGSVRLGLVAPADNDFIYRRGKLLRSACDVSEATKLDTIWTQNDYCWEMIDVKLLCQLPVLHENVRCAFLSLVKVNLAEKKVVFAIISKLGLIENLAVKLETGHAPISAEKCQQQRPIGLVGASCCRRKICIIAYVTGESAAAENSRQIAADDVSFAPHSRLC